MVDFFARERESFFKGIFSRVSAKKKIGVFFVFFGVFVLLGGVFVLFGGVFFSFRALLAKGALKKTREAPCRKFPSSCDLPTYLPEHCEKPHPKAPGWPGRCPISRPVLFLLRTCADVRFSVQMPPKPAGDLAIFRARASARTTPARCAHDRKTPQVPQNGCFWLQMAGHKTGGYRNFLVTFLRAPAHLPTYHGFSSRFF